MLEWKLGSSSADGKHHTAQHTAEKDLLNGVRTALADHKTASQPRALPHAKDR